MTRIAPVLESKCVGCHRPDNQKGGLDLTTLAALLKGGDEGPGMVPSQADKSAIYLRSKPRGAETPEMPKKGDKAFKFLKKEGAALTKAGQLGFDQKKGMTFVQGDINGDGKADFKLQVTGAIDFVKADFVL